MLSESFSVAADNEKNPCPYCEQDADMEIGPDESMEELTDTAELQEIVEGENVEKMDRLLALQHRRRLRMAVIKRDIKGM